MKSFSACVLKLTAVCNLDCDYCYMFNLADKVHARVPPLLPIDTALKTLARIGEHLRETGRKEFDLTLHGGEPTMWPLDRFRILLDRVEEVRAGGLKLRVSMQTNAYRIDPKLLSLLAEHRVGIGVSLDGPPEVNDRYRRDHAGRGSYERVMANVLAMTEGECHDLIGGFLVVSQPTVEPSIFLEWVEGLPLRRVDVLWPIQFNHANPPWRKIGASAYARSPIYGQWFARLFDLWWQQDRPEIYIRLFFQVIERMLGSGIHSDSIVNDELPLFVVNTDGGIEYPDYFRAYRDAGSRTRFNVSENTLSGMIDDPGFAFCLSLGDHLPAQCRSCPEVDICGGGFLPGRMARGEWPPKQKSVLCMDQLHFFSHIRRVVSPQIARQH
jgi:uncharacterized protein